MSEHEWNTLDGNDEAKDNFSDWITDAQKAPLKSDNYYGLAYVIDNFGTKEKQLISEKNRLWIGVMETWSHGAGLKTRNLHMGLESGHFSFIAIHKANDGSFTTWSGSQGNDAIDIEMAENAESIGTLKAKREFKVEYQEGKGSAERVYRVKQHRITPKDILLTDSALYSTTVRLYLVPADNTDACLNRLEETQTEVKWTKHKTEYGKFIPNTGMTNEVHSCVSSSDLMVNYVLSGKWQTTITDKGWYNALGASYRNALKNLVANVVDKVAGTNYSWTFSKTFSSKSCMTWTP